MVKIIEGKKYDTSTAQEVGSWSNGLGRRDFGHINETLYRKRTGEFFIYGEGGPNTCYAERVDTNSWSGGERIMPQSYKQAMKWAEEHLTAEEYEAAFGEVAEDDTKETVCISLTKTAIETARRNAAAAGISISAYFESLVK